MNTLLEKGAHVVVQYPAYQALYEIANSIGYKMGNRRKKQLGFRCRFFKKKHKEKYKSNCY